MLTINSDMLKIEVRKHIEMDAVIGGSYWDEVKQKGCFIACLAHSDDIAILAKKYGFTPMFVRLVEDIFESISQVKRVQFFSDIGENMRDGVDTEMVTWTALRKALERWPSAPEIATVICLLKRVEAGEDRHSLRDEFMRAADAALAADAAARAAAYAAERDQQAADVIAAIKNARCSNEGEINGT